MPKTFPIRLEVEEIALGPVLRRLNEMPGIVKLDLMLGHGGQGPGRKQLEQHAAQNGNGNGRQQLVIKMLMDGPKHIGDISAALGGSKTRAYGLMNSLHKKGLTKTIGGGKHQLTKKAMGQLGATAHATPLLLPPVKHGPGGRASPGSGPILLRSALDAGPLPSSDLRAHLVANGMSPKGVSGVLDRGRKAGLIKRNGQGYELTAKGQKIEIGARAHG